MKTTSIISTISLAIALLCSTQMNAQIFSDLDVSPMDAASFPSDYKDKNKVVKIIYSRPQLKERKLEKLVPNGKVWRTGANEAAEITFYKNVRFGDQEVKPGTYTFFVIPGEKEWTAILSKDLNVWGSYYYDKENDIARTTVSAIRGKEHLEAFSIAFEKSENGATMYLAWSDVRVPIELTF